MFKVYVDRVAIPESVEYIHDADVLFVLADFEKSDFIDSVR